MKVFYTIIVVMAALFFISCQKKGSDQSNDHMLKIISLAPNITETLFMLNTTDNIIGVGEYSNYPERAKNIQVVSSISDLNLELILKLDPDVAFILPSQTKFHDQLTKIGIRCIIVDQRSISKIIASFKTIAEELKIYSRAEVITDSLSGIIDSLRSTVKFNKTMLICVGRDLTGEINSVYTTGKNTFLDDIITLLGYENAIDTDIPYPKINAETIISLDPYIILDLLTLKNKNDIETAVRSWNSLHSLSAVKNNRVYLFTSDYTTIPGPRIFKFMQELSDSLNNLKSRKTKNFKEY
ncbi:MAG: ABC transporter substrate-binding protein [Candidatus Delongbacteria bacterium]|nr:ABC transporter substrate-binding protein [Candidatus Delongbacteria bacterium]